MESQQRAVSENNEERFVEGADLLSTATAHLFHHLLLTCWNKGVVRRFAILCNEWWRDSCYILPTLSRACSAYTIQSLFCLLQCCTHLTSSSLCCVNCSVCLHADNKEEVCDMCIVSMAAQGSRYVCAYVCTYVYTYVLILCFMHHHVRVTECTDISH